MADLNAPGVFIQVKINEETEKGTYNDALYYSFDDFSKLTESDLEDAKKARVDSWLKVFTTPAVVDDPSTEELEAHKSDLETELAQVTAELDTKLAAEAQVVDAAPQG